MNTIRNYLESMFEQLPDTPEIIKAKCELGQMMEDKYSELIQEGKTENEAISQVIAEFGNLDELADTLGIGYLLHHDGKDTGKDREVSLEEVQSYLNDRAHDAVLHGLGTLCGIISPCGIILTEGFGWTSAPGTAAGLLWLFVMIAACVGFHVYASLQMSKWDFLEKESCSIDYGTISMVNDLQGVTHNKTMLQRTIAVLLYCTCYIPLSVLAVASGRGELLTIGIVVLLLMVGLATFFIIVSGSRDDGYHLLLTLNHEQRMEGSYGYRQKYRADHATEMKYTSKTAGVIMSVFWPTVVCVYLILSFLTFSWSISWIIFPIAVVIDRLIKAVYGEKEG
ncbi:MAG: permease prefix domain 1-containing protein [Eubacterium sp.]|nr:permease prefix domain 1-containing protein [Eubacterium sp.]